MFSSCVRTISNRKKVRATVIISEDRVQKILYRCNAYGLDIKGEDIVCSQKAFEARDNEKDKLDKAIALTFIHQLNYRKLT